MCPFSRKWQTTTFTVHNLIALAHSRLSVHAKQREVGLSFASAMKKFVFIACIRTLIKSLMGVEAFWILVSRLLFLVFHHFLQFLPLNSLPSPLVIKHIFHCLCKCYSSCHSYSLIHFGVKCAFCCTCTLVCCYVR